jgi:hypothetical protein
MLEVRACGRCGCQATRAAACAHHGVGQQPRQQQSSCCTGCTNGCAGGGSRRLSAALSVAIDWQLIGNCNSAPPARRYLPALPACPPAGGQALREQCRYGWADEHECQDRTGSRGLAHTQGTHPLPAACIHAHAASCHAVRSVVEDARCPGLLAGLVGLPAACLGAPRQRADIVASTHPSCCSRH